MLTTLRIKNLALVADETIEFQPGYNVITGETGAGKSILIGALNLILGERADRTLIRSGVGDANETCSVEAAFDVSRIRAPIEAFLQEHGLEPCEGKELILKRSLSSGGANRQFINGSPCSLAVLAALGEWLVDIHGPHEHQSLLHASRQLAILDAFAELEGAREAFAELLRHRAGLTAEKAALIVDERVYAQQLDLLRFQVNEIAAARLEAEEEERVEQDYTRASNAARLLQLSQAAREVLSENDGSALMQAGRLGRSLQELQKVDPSTAALLDLHKQAVAALQELQKELSHYADGLELEPGRLQQLEERLNLLQSLKRKYGATLAEVLAFGETARGKLRALEQREAELSRINAELEKNEMELWRSGQELSAKRRKAIPRLSQAVRKQLSELGFKQSRFDVEPSAVSSPAHFLSVATAQGLDTVEFQFAPNPGEPPRRLRAIASSGELARVMLALKTVLAEHDQVAVLVFDEVDANVGGETAHAVGQKMQQIAGKRQVLCITHLPQVAAPASAHYVATKHLQDSRTVSEINLLNDKARVTELARMLGGQSEAARRHAEALLSAA